MHDQAANLHAGNVRNDGNNLKNFLLM